jgi:hypothetical protein
MPLTIHCTQCGANVVPDDLEIRREIAVCSHCSTVLRITAKGTEAYREALQSAAAPQGVVVRREKPAGLLITARRTAGALAINRPELVRGTLIGLAISGGLTAAGALLSVPLILIFGKDLIAFIVISLLLTFIPGSIIAVPASILVLSFTHKTLPPLRLENGTVYPSMLGTKPLPAASIRQLYSTATKVMAGRTEQNFYSYMVYALTTNGHRMPLIGPLDSPESALYIEETLEADLEILNLPVYGDESLPVQETKALPVSPKESQLAGLPCDGCGAALTAGAEDSRRGFVVCRYCGCLTLLYEPGSSKPILGIPSSVPSDSQYVMESDGEGTTVLTRSSAVPLIKITRGWMELSRLTGSQQRIPLDRIASLQIKTMDREGKNESAGAAIAAGMLKLGDAMAYSGEVDPAKFIRDSLASTDYRITAKTKDGKEIPMLSGIRDLPEAFLLLNSLRRVCDLA